MPKSKRFKKDIPSNANAKDISSNTNKGEQSPPDIAAGKLNRGILKRSHDTEKTAGGDSNQQLNKKVRFNSKNSEKTLDPFLSTDVKIELKSDIKVITEHIDIFLDTHKDIVKLYKELGNKLGIDECTNRSGFTSEEIKLLKDEACNTAIDFKGKLKKRENAENDYKSFMEITEQAIDIKEWLEKLVTEARESEH